jgi:stage III sporulation protein AA
MPMEGLPLWCQSLFAYLPAPWVDALRALGAGQLARMQEIRLRSGAPVMVTIGGMNRPLTQDGKMVCSQQQLDSIFLAACEYSPASRMEQIRQGYILLRGGFRMGIAGRCLDGEEGMRAIYPVTAANIRILQQIFGLAKPVIAQIRRGGGIYSTLIVAPPGGGKTTLLRDMIRTLSDGLDGGTPLRMGVVDERGEIAGCVMGVPTLDVGKQSDVLDGCGKAQGMGIMIRSLAPQVIAVDELGSVQDAEMVAEAARCGISVLATAHGACPEDLHRPMLRPVMERGIFQRAVFLSAVPGRGMSVKRLDNDGRAG